MLFSVYIVFSRKRRHFDCYLGVESALKNNWKTLLKNWGAANYTKGKHACKFIQFKRYTFSCIHFYRNVDNTSLQKQDFKFIPINLKIQNFVKIVIEGIKIVTVIYEYSKEKKNS